MSRRQRFTRKDVSRHSSIYTVSAPRHVGFFAILLHTILTFVTGGLWLVVLAIRYLLR